MAANTTVTVHRQTVADHFLIITNDMARGKLPRPLKVMGRCILIHLLSLPSGWQTTRAQLDESFEEGELAVTNGLRELREKGYLVQRRRSTGSSWSWSWEVTDDPIRNPLDLEPRADGESVVAGQSIPRFPRDGSPRDGNRGIREEDGSKKTDSLVPTADAAEDEQTREDVDQLCTRLVERVVENGCKRPTVTRAWRDEARRLIDRDGRSLDEALRLIDWCQADSFWRSNILSMAKFRKQYDALLLRARDTAAWRLASPPTRPEQLDDAALDELLAGERAPSVEAPAHLDVGSIEWQQWQNDRYQQWRRERAAELLEQRRRHA